MPIIEINPRDFNTLTAISDKTTDKLKKIEIIRDCAINYLIRMQLFKIDSFT